MNTTSRASRTPPHRAAAHDHPRGASSSRRVLTIATVLAGAGLLLSACSAGTAGSGGGSAGEHAPKPGVGFPAARSAGSAAPAVAVLLAGPQSIIYTASLTVRAANVAAAADTAVKLVTAAGGYVSAERQTVRPAHSASISIELKIPSAVYSSTLSALQTRLGTQLSLDEHAQDVTQQVADVNSRVTSARAAIRQLRALLSRAGSVTSLLQVQEEINAQESALEALLAQQRALARATSYATVSLLLVGRHVPAGARHKKATGFGGGLSAGWHALKAVVTALLTALGAALPFIVLIVVLGGIGYLGRRRIVRRRAPAHTSPPAAS